MIKKVQSDINKRDKSRCHRASSRPYLPGQKRDIALSIAYDSYEQADRIVNSMRSDISVLIIKAV